MGAAGGMDARPEHRRAIVEVLGRFTATTCAVMLNDGFSLAILIDALLLRQKPRRGQTYHPSASLTIVTPDLSRI
jgi:hypothetical protein